MIKRDSHESAEINLSLGLEKVSMRLRMLAESLLKGKSG